jgi:hypothetical protein
MQTVSPRRAEAMEKTKRQHTVPRFYLERFVKAKTGNIPTFDKLSKRAYETSVWNVAQERFFYDLHPEAIRPEHRNTGIDLQACEKGPAAIEGYFARALDVLIGREDPRGIHPKLQWMLAIQVGIQWIRTRRYRDTIIELSEKAVQAHADELVRRNWPDYPKDDYPTVTLKEHSKSAFHSLSIFDQERWERLAGEFVRHIWLLAVNDNPVPFYTSDHPVVRRANLPDDRTGGIGINSPGVEFFIPVSPRYGLLMLERSFFGHLEQYNGGSVGFVPEQVEVFNRLQVEQSHRHVFCSSGDFTTAKRVCAENPAVCDPDRQTVEITVTQTGPMSTRFEVRVRP